MKLSDFDFDLPDNLIAQSAMEPRDHSKLMVLEKNKQVIEHKKFYNIIDYLVIVVVGGGIMWISEINHEAVEIC